MKPTPENIAAVLSEITGKKITVVGGKNDKAKTA